MLISEAGYANDAAKLQRYASDFGMGVLMANHAAPSGGYHSAGRSTFWSPSGDAMIQAPGPGAYLIIAGNENGWGGHGVPIEIQ